MKTNIKIYPGLLAGQVTLPISKSLAHRVILAKALADAPLDELHNTLWASNIADDVVRTLAGAKELVSKDNLLGIKTDSPCKIYCKDSGTTLRMILPIACTIYDQVEISVSQGLAKRPLGPLLDVLDKGGCKIEITENKDGTFTYLSQGKFQGGLCQLAGNISSQYISGLLYALPLSKSGGEIRLTTELASKPYLDMSLAVLRDFGINITVTQEKGLYRFQVPGKQKFKDTQVNISQGDWSAGAFFAVANALGSSVEMTNLDMDSLQGDKAVYRFIDEIENSNHPVVDLEDYPDLFPVLAVLASYRSKTTTFTGVKRLKLKESDRIQSTKAMLNGLGGDLVVVESPDIKVQIHGTGHLTGGTVDSFNDHRIAMAAAIAATKANEPVTILNSSCCDKSYPGFFQDYAKLGGKIG